MSGSSNGIPEVASADRPGRISRARLAAFQQRAIAARVPVNGSIAPTHRCNLRCVHCYLGAERRSTTAERERDTSFWCSLVDQVAHAGCLNLLLTGGEPLLRDDFAEIYTRARRRGMLVTVFTNGTLLNESHVRLFADLSPVLVEISLYGATRAVYEQVTGVPGSYLRCLEGIAALSRAGVRFGLKTMILTLNRHEVHAMRTLARRWGADLRLDPALFACRDGRDTPLAYRIPAADAAAMELEGPEQLRQAADFFQRMRDTPPDDRLYACMAGLTSFHVDPAGMLLPCMMAASHGFDLRTGGFSAGWREVTPRFRDQTARPENECRHCQTRFLCGLCPALFALESGSPQRKSEYFCRLGAERRRIVAEELDRRAREAIICR